MVNLPAEIYRKCIDCYDASCNSHNEDKLVGKEDQNHYIVISYRNRVHVQRSLGELIVAKADFSEFSTVNVVERSINQIEPFAKLIGICANCTHNRPLIADEVKTNKVYEVD